MKGSVELSPNPICYSLMLSIETVLYKNIIRSRIHERTISLRFLGIILRDIEVSVWIS